jgi:hypothetical protein
MILEQSGVVTVVLTCTYIGPENPSNPKLEASTCTFSRIDYRLTSCDKVALALWHLVQLTLDKRQAKNFLGDPRQHKYSLTPGLFI